MKRFSRDVSICFLLLAHYGATGKHQVRFMDVDDGGAGGPLGGDGDSDGDGGGGGGGDDGGGDDDDDDDNDGDGGNDVSMEMIMIMIEMIDVEEIKVWR
eukprot:761860-Hanusia_phi.AAC.2